MERDSQIQEISFENHLPPLKTEENFDRLDTEARIITSEEQKNTQIDTQINNDFLEKERKVNFSIKESKQMSIIKQFHQIYQTLSGKCFVVQSEVEYQNCIEYHQKLLNMELVVFITSFLSLINAILFYELTYERGVEKLNEEHYFIFLYNGHILSILFFISLFMKDILKTQQSGQKHYIYETFRDTKEYPKLIAFLLICIVYPSPIFFGKNMYETVTDYNMEVSYSVNSVLIVVVLFRSFFILRPLLYLSAYMDPQTAYACKQFNFEPNLYFSIKCQAQSSSLLLYSFALLISLCALSYGVRIFERPAAEQFDNYLNALWLIIITMTTVGYGDVTAKTIGGRVISMISCICGVFLVSMVIVTITSRLTLDRHEYLMFIIFNKTQRLEKEKKGARGVISKYLNIVRKSPNRGNYGKIFETSKPVNEMKKIIKKFNDTVNQQVDSNSQDFTTFYNRISFFIELQKQLIKRRNEVFDAFEQLKGRIIDMRCKGYL